MKLIDVTEVAGDWMVGGADGAVDETDNRNYYSVYKHNAQVRIVRKKL